MGDAEDDELRRALEHRQRADARPKGDAEKATKNATGQRSGWPIGSYTMIEPSNREPAVGIEPTTARLRIGCSTTELRWRTVEVKPSDMPWRGLEPRRLSAPPPQDGVSTNFTTRAEQLGNRDPGAGNRSYLQHRA